jgi:predicted nucleotidyltransferase
MRLSEMERASILSAVRSRDASAEVWLFGSRADDQARGGDIDLLLISGVVSIAQKIDILVEIKFAIGERRIDLHIVAPGSKHQDPLAASVLPRAVRLT